VTAGVPCDFSCIDARSSGRICNSLQGNTLGGSSLRSQSSFRSARFMPESGGAWEQGSTLLSAPDSQTYSIQTIRIQTLDTQRTQ